MSASSDITRAALFAPRGVPAQLTARLEVELPKARSDPALTRRAAGVGMTMLLAPANMLRARMEAEVPCWKQLIDELGLKVE
ncbi:MAG: hypothetical protein IT537_12155 [Hyphomicrobiales bacterium]|nr:hypothetical protein [Hyphomicrobiales bacterium]